MHFSTQLSATLALSLMVSACGNSPPTTNADAERTSGVDTTSAVSESPVANTVFFSGHSLMDQPMPGFVAAIAAEQGVDMRWNRHYIVGSSIERRVRGANVAGSSWDGLREGFNRDSENLDILREIATGASVGGRPYNALVVTEQHVLLDAVLNNGTAKYLKFMHDQVIAANPNSTTYFYEPWLSLNDLDDPRLWMDYERAASRAWGCVVVRVNHSLAAQGRRDRIVSLPIGLAVVKLVEAAISPEGLAGLPQGSTRRTLQALFYDTVHLRPLGAYYTAMVVYSELFRRSPVGAWHPPEVTAEQARSLQELAWEFTQWNRQRTTADSLEACAKYMVDFNGTFWAYMRDAYWVEQGLSFPRRYGRWVRGYWAARATLTAQDSSNPFYFDPDADRSYWFVRANE